LLDMCTIRYKTLTYNVCSKAESSFVCCTGPQNETNKGKETKNKTGFENSQ